MLSLAPFVLRPYVHLTTRTQVRHRTFALERAKCDLSKFGSDRNGHSGRPHRHHSPSEPHGDEAEGRRCDGCPQSEPRSVAHSGCVDSPLTETPEVLFVSASNDSATSSGQQGRALAQRRRRPPRRELPSTTERGPDRSKGAVRALPAPSPLGSSFHSPCAPSHRPLSPLPNSSPPYRACR